jgi:hypothetical protein
MDSDDYRYLTALVNTSKHRSIIYTPRAGSVC